MRRFVPEICGVECEVAEKVVQNLMFLPPPKKKWGKARKFVGAFVNWHHFQPTGEVWLRSHGWSFIFADEIKMSMSMSMSIVDLYSA